ncbi:MAG: hypothetical protein RLZZ244_630 [Verrucomicrobiota bacterium]
MKNRPWIWIVVAWGVLLLATGFTVHLCQTHAPQSVPLPAPPAHAR